MRLPIAIVSLAALLAVACGSGGGSANTSPTYDVDALGRLFAAYAARGVDTRQRAIISRAERDLDPLTGTGESSTSTGALASWVPLS